MVEGLVRSLQRFLGMLEGHQHVFAPCYLLVGHMTQQLFIRVVAITTSFIFATILVEILLPEFCKEAVRVFK